MTARREPDALVGYDHLNLTVSDLAHSVAWYRDVFGFVAVRESERAEFARAVLLHHGSGTAIGLTRHHGAPPEAFSELRAGMDHVAFRLAEGADLETWKRHLEELSVVHSDPKAGAAGRLITLRDPDNIQVEVYAPGG